jgi:glycopeptide antibiotics resistance protein
MSVSWDPKHYNPFYIGPYETTLSLSAFLPVGLALLGVCLVLLRRRGKSAGYLLAFSIFAVYLWKLAEYTVFPFPIHLDPGGFKVAGLHLVPALVEGDDPNFRLDHEQVWGNFLTGVPFGFGASCVVPARYSAPRRIIGLCLGIALAPELIQLLQNALFRDFLMRTVDIDDVWLSLAGALSGYGVLSAVARIYRRIGWERGARLPVWKHFHEVLLRMATRRTSSEPGA